MTYLKVGNTVRRYLVNISPTFLQSFPHLALQDLLPHNNTFSQFLCELPSAALQEPAQHLAIAYNITTERAIEEFRRLLAIKIFTHDTNADKISPTALMDELWHAAVLDTQLYADLQAALKLVIHHRPSGASEQESMQRVIRLTTMKALYRVFFKADPLEFPSPTSLLQNKIKVFVKSVSDKTFALTVARSDTVESVKIKIQRKEGIPASEQRLIFDSMCLDNGRLLSDYEMESEDTLYVALRQLGC